VKDDKKFNVKKTKLNICDLVEKRKREEKGRFLTKRIQTNKKNY